MNELVAAVRARAVERGGALLLRSRRRVLIVGLTCFGTGAVLVGVVVWSSRYLPPWVVAVSLGLGGLGAAYGLERGARRRPRATALDAHRTDYAGRTAEASGEKPHGGAVDSPPMTHPTVVGEERAISRSERTDSELGGRTTFTLGALVGVGLVHAVKEMRARNRGPR